MTHEQAHAESNGGPSLQCFSNVHKLSACRDTWWEIIVVSQAEDVQSQNDKGLARSQSCTRNRLRLMVSTHLLSLRFSDTCPIFIIAHKTSVPIARSFRIPRRSSKPNNLVSEFNKTRTFRVGMLWCYNEPFWRSHRSSADPLGLYLPPHHIRLILPPLPRTVD